MKQCMANIFGILLILSIMPNFNAFGDESTVLFAKVQPSLAIITTPLTSGSGSIVLIEGKKYLLTNEHVTRGGKPISIRMLSGSRLTYTGIDVADEQDLIRFELSDQTIPALEINNSQVNIGQPVFVFGNSDGAGVATSMKGSVLGIGPDTIEIDASFIQGNSGSPIINQTGQVIAVATYAIKLSEPNDWIKKGTRFNDIRRMCLRLNTVNWVSIATNDYFLRADALADLNTYCSDLYEIHYGTKFSSTIRAGLYSYTFNDNKARYRRFAFLCQLVADAISTANDAIANETKMQKISEAAKKKASKPLKNFKMLSVPLK